jgi:hypothetical protein
MRLLEHGVGRVFDWHGAAFVGHFEKDRTGSIQWSHRKALGYGRLECIKTLLPRRRASCDLKSIRKPILFVIVHVIGVNYVACGTPPRIFLPPLFRQIYVSNKLS